MAPKSFPTGLAAWGCRPLPLPNPKFRDVLPAAFVEDLAVASAGEGRLLTELPLETVEINLIIQSFVDTGVSVEDDEDEDEDDEKDDVSSSSRLSNFFLKFSNFFQKYRFLQFIFLFL